jgi:hypothetical protein
MYKINEAIIFIKLLFTYLDPEAYATVKTFSVNIFISLTMSVSLTRMENSACFA